MMYFKKYFALDVFIKIIFVIKLTFITHVVYAESWDFRDKSLSFAAGYEDKTDNEIFEGTKIVLDAQYVLKSEQGEISEKLKCCAWPSRPEHFNGLIDAKFRWSVDDSDMEYIRLGFTPWASMWYAEHDSADKLNTEYDLVEYAGIRYITDDALEVDSYLELSFLRGGRTGTFNWSENSPFTVELGIQAAIGWAWAESQNTLYSKVSNPFNGIFFNIAIEHEKWGRFYTRNRFVNGFSFSSPARGHPTVREARVRIGYLTQQLFSCYTLDLYIEKRSFYFDEGDLPGLYKKSATGMAEFTCKW